MSPEIGEFKQELIKLILDKGMLALLILLLGHVLSRSLERLKSSLSWGAEVLKQKLKVANIIVHELRELSYAHIESISIFGRTGNSHNKGTERLLDVLDRMESSLSEARLVLKRPTLLAVTDAYNKSTDWLTCRDPWVKKVGVVHEEQGEKDGMFARAVLDGVDPEARAAIEKDIEETKAIIDKATAALQAEFPDLLGAADD